MATKDNKELVIAERVEIKMKAEIIAFILMSIFTMLAVSGFSLIFYPFVCILLGFSIIILEMLWFVSTIINIVHNNDADINYITYKNGVFTVHDIKQKIEFKKEHLVEVFFKQRKNWSRIPNKLEDHNDNYGTLVIWYKLDENNIFRITLKHTLIQRDNFEIVFGKGKVEAQ